MYRTVGEVRIMQRYHIRSRKVLERHSNFNSKMDDGRINWKSEETLNSVFLANVQKRFKQNLLSLRVNFMYKNWSSMYLLHFDSALRAWLCWKFGEKWMQSIGFRRRKRGIEPIQCSLRRFPHRWSRAVKFTCTTCRQAVQPDASCQGGAGGL